MAIPAQRPLPSELIINESKFEIIYGVEAIGKLRGGGTTLIESWDPYWRCTITSSEVRARTFITLRTWVDSLRGGYRSFLAHDQARPHPNAYASIAAVQSLTRAGGGSFDGTASITDFPTAYSLEMDSGGSSRLPAGFQLKAGDYVSVVKTGTPNRYSLHRITEDATADGSGQIAALSIEPFIRTSIFSTGDKVNFLLPLGEFVIDQESIDGTPNPRATSITFSGLSKV